MHSKLHGFSTTCSGGTAHYNYKVPESSYFLKMHNHYQYVGYDIVSSVFWGHGLGVAKFKGSKRSFLAIDI